MPNEFMFLQQSIGTDNTYLLEIWKCLGSHLLCELSINQLIKGR